MSFFNLYNKPNYNYLKSIKAGNSIFAVGEILLNGSNPKTLLTKLNINGDVIWEKAYSFVNSETFIRNYDIIECDNGDLLMMGREPNDYNYKSYITRIKSTTGAIVWQKRSNLKLIGYDNSIVSVGNDKYVFALMQPDANGRTVIFKIDGNGNILASKTVGTVDNLSGFRHAGIVKGPNKIGLYGYAVHLEN
ncbi:MAG: hypothetical protein QM710_14940 [Flavobacterium sp.]